MNRNVMLSLVLGTMFAAPLRAATVTVFSDDFSSSTEQSNLAGPTYPTGVWYEQNSPSWMRDDQSPSPTSVAINSIATAPLTNPVLQFGFGYDEAVVLYNTAAPINTAASYTFSGQWELTSSPGTNHVGFIPGLVEFNSSGAIVQFITADTIANAFGDIGSATVGDNGTFSITATAAQLATLGVSSSNYIGVYLHHDDDGHLESDYLADNTSGNHKNDVYVVDNVLLTATTAAIPTPAALPAGLALLGGIATLRRRRAM